MQKIVDTVTRFIRETVWLERRGVKGAWGFLWRLLRVCVMVGRGFYDDNCFLRASGLAFTTLLSEVCDPFVDLVHGVLSLNSAGKR